MIAPALLNDPENWLRAMLTKASQESATGAVHHQNGKKAAPPRSLLASLLRERASTPRMVMIAVAFRNICDASCNRVTRRPTHSAHSCDDFSLNTCDWPMGIST